MKKKEIVTATKIWYMPLEKKSGNEVVFLVEPVEGRDVPAKLEPRNWRPKGGRPQC